MSHGRTELFLLTTLTLLVGCGIREQHHRERSRTLSCGGLSNPEWDALCRRFELHLAVVPGNGLARNERFVCDVECIDTVCCSGLTMTSAQIDEIIIHVNDQVGAQKMVDSGLIESLTLLSYHVETMAKHASGRPLGYRVSQCAK